MALFVGQQHASREVFGTKPTCLFSEDWNWLSEKGKTVSAVQFLSKVWPISDISSLKYTTSPGILQSALKRETTPVISTVYNLSSSFYKNFLIPLGSCTWLFSAWTLPSACVQYIFSLTQFCTGIILLNPGLLRNSFELQSKQTKTIYSITCEISAIWLA